MIAVGDKVKITSPFKDDCRIVWIPEMDETIGMEGIVTEEYIPGEDIYNVRFNDTREFWYKIKSLEKI